MKLLRQQDYPNGKFRLAFVDYQEESSEDVIEPTYNYGIDQYDLGNAFGHIAIGVDDIYAVCEHIRSHSGIISREPGPMQRCKTIIAFAKDPDGYLIELITRN